MTLSNQFLWLMNLSLLLIVLSFEVEANDPQYSAYQLSDSDRYELKKKLWDNRGNEPEDWIQYCRENNLDLNGEPLTGNELSVRKDDLLNLPVHIREQYLLLKTYQKAGSSANDDLISFIEMLYLE